MSGAAAAAPIPIPIDDEVIDLGRPIHPWLAALLAHWWDPPLSRPVPPFATSLVSRAWRAGATLPEVRNRALEAPPAP